MTEEELKEIGVNPENLTYPDGEYNIIVQMFGKTDKEILECEYSVWPLNYMPRKERCSDWGEVCLIDDEQKEDLKNHLIDSSERLKILAYLLSKQADEIEKFGFPKTDAYCPKL